MNNPIENLHTAIRRYCIEKHTYWVDKYSELLAAGETRIGSGYTDEARNVFPRYNVLNAILFEVERYRAGEFKDLSETKLFFQLLAIEAQGQFTRSPKGPIESKAIEEERAAVSAYIGGLTEKELSAVEPLFYRRVLSAEESSGIREKLRSRWGITGRYWFPLEEEKRDDIEAFQAPYFEKEVGPEKINDILRLYGTETVWEIREHSGDYELHLSAFEPYYNGAEGFWCDNSFDWIIYASHESSITIGGRLLPAVRTMWTNWRDRIWTTPFFERPGSE